MKILGIERDNTACNHYRVLQPLYKLRSNGLADALTIRDVELHTDYAVDKALESDIILFQRPADKAWFDFIKICQKHGKIIVLDYDDDPFNTHPMNPYYKFVGTKEYYYKWPSGDIDQIWKDGENGFDIERNITRNDMFKASFRRADMVTTTTDILGGFFRTLNPNVRSLPNLVDFQLFGKYDLVKDDKVRIGYQGGVSHYEDLYVMRDAIREVLKANDNAIFVYMGDYRFNKLFQDLPTNRVEIRPWVNFTAYPFALPLLNLDIGLCPLVNNSFNRNKSALKYFDYSVVGAATVASNIPPYEPIITDGLDGLLATDKDEWVEKLTMLCKDKEKRQTLAQRAYDNVYENHNADKKAHLWAEAYESLMKQEVCT